MTCFDDSGEHHHPRLAAERSMVMTHLFGSLERNMKHEGVVHDVFGNTAELTRRGVVHHSTMPVRHPSDSARVLAAGRSSFCQHQPGLCNCAKFSVAVAIQSLQYLQVDELFDVIINTESKMLFAVVHRFDGIAGSKYNKEMSWYRTGIHTVRCEMDSGTTVWEHDALDWLDKPLYSPTRKGWCIVANMTESIGETFVYCLMFQRTSSVPPSLTSTDRWEVAVGAQEELVYNLPRGKGEVFERGHSLHGFTIARSTFRVLPGVLVFSLSEEVQVVLSPALVDSLVSYAQANVINGSLYRQMLRMAKGAYTNVPNYPADRISTASMTSVMLALSLAPSLSVANLDDLLWKQEGVFETHNSMLGFKRPWSVSSRTLGMCALSTSVSYGVSQTAPISLTANTSTVAVVATHVHASCLMSVGLGVATVSVPPLAAAWIGIQTVATVAALWYYSGRHQDTAAQSWASQQPGTVTYMSKDVTHLDLVPSFGPTTKLKPPKKGSGEIKMPPNDCRDEPKKLLLQTGIAFEGVVPTYYPSDATTLENAVRSRLLIDTPKPAPGAWDAAEQIYCATRRHQFYLKAPTVRIDRDFLGQLLAGKYPKGKVLHYLKEYDELVQCGYVLRNEDKEYGAFVKVEKQVALVIANEELPVEHEEKNPRCILCMPDRLLALSLGINERLMQGLKDAYEMELEQHGLPGVGPRWCSAEKFGNWASSAADKCGEFLIISFDAERFDAHSKEEALRFGAKVLLNSRKFEDNAVKKVMQPRKAVIKSRLGLKVILKELQRLTGEWKTDVENSELELTVVLYSLFKGLVNLVKSLGKYCFLATCGDDNVVFINKQFVNYLLQRQGRDHVTNMQGELDAMVKENALELGYKLTGNVTDSWTKAEFCSKLFYPVGETRILGGKIGRVLAKSGWFFENDSNPITSACISQLRDNYHVPFLREYFQRVVALTRTSPPSHGKEEVHSWHTSESHEYDLQTCEFVAERYGLTEQDLVDFVALLDQCTQLPVVIKWVHLARCIEIDNA